MSCRVGDLSIGLSVIFFFFFFFVGEFLSVNCLSVSCLPVSCRVTVRSLGQSESLTNVT